MDYELGTLYLIPTPLGPDTLLNTIPQPTYDVAASLNLFIVEDPKTARQFLKRLVLTHPIQSIELLELNEHSIPNDIKDLLNPLMQGKNVGLISDAGCPAIADPGAKLVRLAHKNGISVVPLVGPSSIVLALMASGLNGQQFCFHGYLPKKAQDRNAALRKVEQQSKTKDETQIFIETPYRNVKLLESILETCKNDTWLCLATDLTFATEEINTKKVSQWRRAFPEIDKRPTVFLLYANDE